MKATLLNPLFLVIAISLIILSLSIFRSVFMAFAETVGPGDPCPDPGHCTCINGVLHDDLMQFPINDGCRSNSDGSITD